MDEGYDRINVGGPATSPPAAARARCPAARSRSGAAARGGPGSEPAERRGRPERDGRRRGARRHHPAPQTSRRSGAPGRCGERGRRAHVVAHARARSSCSRRSSASPACRPAARGTPTRATTCSTSWLRPRRRRPAAGPADVDRRLPPRRRLLLPARAGRVARGGGPRGRRRRDRPVRRRRGARCAMAGTERRRARRRAHGRRSSWRSRRRPSRRRRSSGTPTSSRSRARSRSRPRGGHGRRGKRAGGCSRAAAQAATMQCHVLGFVLVPPLIVWLIADARRRHGPERQAVVRVAARRDRDRRRQLRAAARLGAPDRASTN